jgi:hypothetical protein
MMEIKGYIDKCDLEQTDGRYIAAVVWSFGGFEGRIPVTVTIDEAKKEVTRDDV